MKDDGDLLKQGREFFTMQREQELTHLKANIEKWSSPAVAPMAPSFATLEPNLEVAVGPIPPATAIASSIEALEVLHSTIVEPPLNAWEEHPMAQDL